MAATFGLLAALAVVAIAVDAGSFAVAAPRAARPAAVASCPTANGKNPYTVAQKFLATAVERKDLAASYGLATPSLRHGVSCADWVKGRLPLPKVEGIDWKRSGFEPVAGGDAQIVLRIFLAQPNAALPASFLMELRQHHGNWQVGSFQPDKAAPADEALAA
jgi:hypothetical protein